MRYSLLAGAVTIAFILSATSAIAQYDDESIDCKKPHGDLEMTICAGRLEQQSYQEMEAVYQQLEQKYQSAKEGPKDYRDKQRRYLKVYGSLRSPDYSLATDSRSKRHPQ
jgi:uncharacterized protein